MGTRVVWALAVGEVAVGCAVNPPPPSQAPAAAAYPEAEQPTETRPTRQVSKPDDRVSGSWVVDWKDTAAMYKYRWVVTPSGPGRWRVEQTLLHSSDEGHRDRVGERAHDLSLRELESGELVVHGRGKGPHPLGSSAFVQRAVGTLDGGRVLGSGTHAAADREHEFDFHALREDADDLLVGTWIVTWNEPRASHRFRWVISHAGPGTWRIEQTLLESDSDSPTTAAPPRAHDLLLTSTASGLFHLYRQGSAGGRRLEEMAAISLRRNHFSGKGTRIAGEWKHDFDIVGRRNVPDGR